MPNPFTENLYGTYRNVKFVDIFPDIATWQTEITACKLPLTTLVGAANSSQMTQIYYLLYAKYGNSTIAGSDVEQWKYRLYAKIFQFAPTWWKRMEVQAAIRGLSLSDLQTGGKVIYNHANNPSAAPSTGTLEELEYIDDQNTSNYKKSAIEAYGLQWGMLDDDVTGAFLEQFRKLFLTVVAPELPLLYPEGM